MRNIHSHLSIQREVQNDSKLMVEWSRYSMIFILKSHDFIIVNIILIEHIIQDFSSILVDYVTSEMIMNCSKLLLFLFI